MKAFQIVDSEKAMKYKRRDVFKTTVHSMAAASVTHIIGTTYIYITVLRILFKL